MTKKEFYEKQKSEKTDNSKPIKVYECDDKYVLVDDGSHRVTA